MLGFRVKCRCSTCFTWGLFRQNGKAQGTREQAHMARGEQQGLVPKTQCQETEAVAGEGKAGKKVPYRSAVGGAGSNGPEPVGG